MIRRRDPRRRRRPRPRRQSLVANLDRLWHVCQVQPDVCTTETEHYVTVTRDMAAHPEASVTAAQLLPLVRDRTYLESLDADARAKVFSEPLVADLLVVYVVAFGEGVRSVQAYDPDQESLTKLAQAIDGMYRIAQRPVSRTLLEWSERGWTEFRH